MIIQYQQLRSAHGRLSTADICIGLELRFVQNAWSYYIKFPISVLLYRSECSTISHMKKIRETTERWLYRIKHRVNMWVKARFQVILFETSSLLTYKQRVQLNVESESVNISRAHKEQRGLSETDICMTFSVNKKKEENSE